MNWKGFFGEELHAELTAYCKKNKITMSSLIKSIIMEKFNYRFVPHGGHYEN